jgi:hypothetical protein
MLRLGIVMIGNSCRGISHSGLSSTGLFHHKFIGGRFGGINHEMSTRNFDRVF